LNPDAPTRLYGLDHLRTLAIVFVFVFHYGILSGGQPEWLFPIARFGWTGVDLFFVLSGFLISLQLFSQIKKENSIAFSAFFIKRFLRILPAYWFVVAIYFCFPFFHEREALPPLWKFLTFTQNLHLDISKAGTFSHAWSLCVEEHFYLLLPVMLSILLLLKKLRKSYWLLAGLFIAGLLVRWYSYDVLYLPTLEQDNHWMYWYKYLYYPTYNRVDGLLAGVSIAAVYIFRPLMRDKMLKHGNAFILLSLILLTGAYFICEDQQTFHASVFGFPLVAAGYSCMLIGAISPSCFLYKWQSKTTTLIATLSYALYLSHKGIVHITQQLLESYHLNANLIFVICILTCVTAAIILNRLIERPFMKLRSKLIKQHE
jgi:peptidoglycan/LPS O-acetylase OafA/YrhL